MSGILNRLRGRKEKLSREELASLRTAAVTSELSRPMQEVERQQNLGIDNELIHDDVLDKLMEQQIYVPVDVDDGNGGSQRVMMIDYNMAALRNCTTHVNRASFIGQKDKRLVMLHLRAALLHVKIQVKRPNYNLGFGNYLQSMRVYQVFAVNDAVEGKKARLLKTIPRTTEISVNQERPRSW